MKKTFGVSTLAALLLLSISGCSTKQNIDPSVFAKKTNEERIAQKPSEIQKIASDGLNKDVNGSFYQTTVYSAVKAMSEQVGVKVDSSYIPAEKYRITVDFDGNLKDFLKHVKATTSLDYRYRKNAVVLMNKDVIDESISGKQCAIGSQPSVIMSFKDVSPSQVFKYFSDTYGMTFVYKTKYHNYAEVSSDGLNIGGGQSSSTLLSPPKASLQYKGCDPREALRIFLSANNLIMEEMSPGNYNVMDYEIATIDIPLYFDYTFESSSGVGSGGGSNSASNSGGGASGGKVVANESPKKDLAAYIQKFIGPKGKVEVSNRGYITIEDSPENIRSAKKLLVKEIAKQRPIALEVSVVRIDVNDGSSMGVNWDLVTNLVGSPGKIVSLSTDYATSLTGGGALTIAGDKTTQLIKALERFGNTTIVREYRTKTKSGILNSFKAVEQIPYVTTTTTSSSAGFESNVEAKVAEAGLIINILPSLDKNGESVDLSANIVVSEYLGDKKFNMSSGEFSLPRIATNEVKIPGRIALGETMILTGFKVSSDKASKEGLPGIIRIPNSLLSGLGGLSTTDNSESEFVIVITPKEIEEI